MNKWSTERTIKFIKIYEQHPCLWDINLDSYRSREKRREAYENISKAMQIENFGVMDVRTKIRTLRNTYTLELAKTLKNKKCTITEDFQKPKPAWFPIADRFFSKVSQTEERPSSDHKVCLLSENLNEIQSRRSPSPPLPPPPPSSSEDIDVECSKIHLNAQDDYDVFGAFIANELRGLGNKHLVRLIKKKIQCAILSAYEEQAKTFHVNDCEASGSCPSNSSFSESEHIKTECLNDDQVLSAIKGSILASQRSSETIQGP